MLSIEAEGRTRFEALHDRIDAARIIAAAELASAERGHTWTQGQKDATRGLLMSPASVTGIQGSAGTAKTTTVLATYARAARAQGLSVRALAPTAGAADVLGRAIASEPMTVAKMLINSDKDIEQECEAWIVDEASMLSARDSAQLIARACDARARLILVGDVAQLGSVEAGRAFGQLQEHGMPTFILDQIVRQTNVHTLEAVEAMLAGEAATAFAALDTGGGSIVEHAEEDIRRAFIARDFVALSPQERADTLVLDPTREGRQRLTDTIRLALRGDGTLGPDAITATVLEPRNLTRAETANAASYIPGDIVLFRRGNRSAKIARGQGYRVESIDPDAGTLSLLNPKGSRVDWQPSRWGGSEAEVYREIEQEFRSGERIQFTRNNPNAHRRNGMIATVTALDPDGAGLTVALPDGSTQTLDLNRLTDRHFRQGWVQTIHSAQSATAERVLAHMESFRTNIVDAAAAYVAISRARSHAALYTDSRAALTEALGLRDGAQVGAIDGAMQRESSIDFDIKSEGHAHSVW
nr:AAA family ATPase [Stakelama sediminis]